MTPNLPALFRAQELEALGYTRHFLRAMLRRGEVVRIARGLYRLTEAELHEHESLAAASKLVPGGVICLLSALSFHEIGTQLPHQVWIAIDRKARLPEAQGIKLRVVRFNSVMRQYDVEIHEFLGVPVRITSSSRTVVDCFRFVDTVGLDVALEALKDSLRQKSVTVDELVRAGEMIEVDEQMKPYLEAVLA